MYILKLFLLTCLFCIKNGDANSKKRLSFSGTCSDDDNNFQRCYAANFKRILSMQTNSLDPLLLEEVVFQNAKTANIEIDLELRNVKVQGIKTAIFKDARLLSKTDCTSSLTMLVPRSLITFDYSVNGTAFSFPLDSEGIGFYKIKQILAEIHIECKKLPVEDGCTFGYIEAVKVYFPEIKKFYLNWDILSGGNEDLEAQANAVLNENWREVWELVLPTFQSTMEPILFDRFKKLSTSVPFSCN